MSEPIMLEIKSCHDCPRLKTREVRHFLLGHHPGYEYHCTQASRLIYPSEGVEPPPDWCPKRAKAGESDE